MHNSQARCVLASNEYGHYAVPISCEHRPASQRILAGRVHEPRTLAFMTEHCGSRDIVHAGAFFGDFLPALAKAVEASALLWAFEPNPENYTCASWTVRLNGLSNCRLHHAGLGSENAVRPLY